MFARSCGLNVSNFLCEACEMAAKSSGASTAAVAKAHAVVARCCAENVSILSKASFEIARKSIPASHRPTFATPQAELARCRDSHRLSFAAMLAVAESTRLTRRGSRASTAGPVTRTPRRCRAVARLIWLKEVPLATKSSRTSSDVMWAATSSSLSATFAAMPSFFGAGACRPNCAESTRSRRLRKTVPCSARRAASPLSASLALSPEGLMVTKANPRGACVSWTSGIATSSTSQYLANRLRRSSEVTLWCRFRT
mmetsp:Transcript_14113/g.48922  ORF Transcript_14113/g.48922 Transcript_14113/m.48922 type:complete len:255 (+) Transcript_14113:1245-2009(+)